jgi:hypothetical protein
MLSCCPAECRLLSVAISNVVRCRPGVFDPATVLSYLRFRNMKQEHSSVLKTPIARRLEHFFDRSQSMEAATSIMEARPLKVGLF